MIIQKHDYKNLKRKNVDGKRHYIVEGETYDPVPSVTTILSRTKDQRDVDALNEWRKNVGYARAQSITNEAANRGTRMHNYLEKYMLTGSMPIPGTNPYAQHANGMAVTIAQHGFKLVNEVWGTEVNLFFPKIYGGSTDCVGIHDNDEVIIDFKQSNKLKKREWITDYFLQTTAYGEAHNEVYGTHINKGVIMVCTKDWEYQEFIIKGKEYDDYRRQWWKRVEQYYKMDK